MIFGIMDHCDLNPAVSQADHYAARLRQIELYDQAGFYGYHLTEHHCTPLGGGASPNVFLAAAAQRSTRLRLGTMVYALPLHHPIRLIEEICMVDQMCAGRLEMGFGRGSVPMELAYFGIDPEEARDRYDEALEIVTQGLRDGLVDFEGRYFEFRDVPIKLRPLQTPMPPIWYGVHSLESAERAARLGFNIVCNEPRQESARYIDRFRTTWRDVRGSEPIAKIGLVRSVVVQANDADALATARRAHLSHHENFIYLFRRHGREPRISGRETSFDALVAAGRAVAGCPARVADVLQADLDATGATYCVLRAAFGDMSGTEMQTSATLFAERVMPALAHIGEPVSGEA